MYPTTENINISRKSIITVRVDKRIRLKTVSFFI